MTKRRTGEVNRSRISRDRDLLVVGDAVEKPTARADLEEVNRALATE